METVNWFEFEMNVLSLLDAGLDVAGDDGIVVLALANVLKQTAVTNFTGCDVDTAQIEDNFAEQLFLYDGENVGIWGSVDDDFLQ